MPDWSRTPTDRRVIPARERRRTTSAVERCHTLRQTVVVGALLFALSTLPTSVGVAAELNAPAAVPTTPAAAPPKTPPAPASTAVAAPAPAAIPVPQIVARAAETKKLLDDLDAMAQPTPAIVQIQERLPEIRAKLGPEFKSTLEILEQGPPVGIQERLTQSWRTCASELTQWQDVVTKRATELERELDRLAGLRTTWVQTLADAKASHTPAPVLQNVEKVLADLETARLHLQGQRAMILVLQDQVAGELTRCQGALAEIARLREGSLKQTFARSAPPIWSREARRANWAALPGRIRDELLASVVLLGHFASEYAVRLVLHVLLFIALIFMARSARSWAHGPAADRGEVPASAVVFDRPYAAATVIALVSVLWIYPVRPRTVGDVAAILGLLPLLRVVRPLIARALVPALDAFAVLALVDRLRAQLVAAPLGDQIILMAEMLPAIGLLAWLLGSRRLRRALVAEGMTPLRLRVTGIGVVYALWVCTVAFGAAAYGALRLARSLGSGLLVDILLVIGGYAAIKVVEGLLAFSFRAWPLCRLGMVSRHHDLLERRAHRVFGVIMAVTCVVAVLTHRSLLEPATALGRTILGAELRRGGITVGDVLAFALTVCLAFLTSTFIRFLLEEDVFPHLRLGPGLPYTISSLLHYAVLVVGFLLAIAALGVDLNKVTILAGAFGVGLGFGLQGVVNNFVSGLIVLLERPMQVGDVIQMGDVSGQVRRIGIRSSTLQTAEGAEIILPNASLVAEKVTNWTLSAQARRIDVPVNVAYGTPPQKVLELLRGVAGAHPDVLATPVPEALFLAFADSALKFELRAWTARLDRWLLIKSDLNVAVYAALQGAGIEIPLPQREVRLRQP